MSTFSWPASVTFSRATVAACSKGIGSRLVTLTRWNPNWVLTGAPTSPTGWVNTAFRNSGTKPVSGVMSQPRSPPRGLLSVSMVSADARAAKSSPAASLALISLALASSATRMWLTHACVNWAWLLS